MLARKLHRFHWLQGSPARWLLLGDAVMHPEQDGKDTANAGSSWETLPATSKASQGCTYWLRQNSLSCTQYDSHKSPELCQQLVLVLGGCCSWSAAFPTFPSPLVSWDILHHRLQLLSAAVLAVSLWGGSVHWGLFNICPEGSLVKSNIWTMSVLHGYFWRLSLGCLSYLSRRLLPDGYTGLWCYWELNEDLMQEPLKNIHVFSLPGKQWFLSWTKVLKINLACSQHIRA